MQTKKANAPEHCAVYAIPLREKSEDTPGSEVNREAKQPAEQQLVLPSCVHVRFSEAELLSFWHKL